MDQRRVASFEGATLASDPSRHARAAVAACESLVSAAKVSTSDTQLNRSIGARLHGRVRAA